MRRTFLAVFLLTLGTRGWTEGASGGNDASSQIRRIPSRVLELNERRPNVLREATPPDPLLHLETQPGPAAMREHADGLKASHPVPGNIVHLKESVPVRMRSTREAALESAPGTPLVLKLAMTISLPRPAGPNEQVLWRMLEGGRYAALLERFARLQTAFPHWRPPRRLVELAQEGLLREKIEQARETSDHAALVLLAQNHPEAFACNGVVAAWSLAQAHAAMGRQSAAEDVARRLLACPNEADRLATLYKSREWMASGWERLIAIEERMPRSPDGEEKFSRLRYDHRMERLLAAVDNGANETALRLLPSLMPEIERRRDAGAALLAGWVRYRAGRYGDAAAAFTDALQWDAARHEARHGLALVALQERRHEEALHQAESMPADTSGRRELLRDIRVAQAQESYAAARHEEALRLLDAARAHAPLPRYAGLIEAWSRLQLGDADAAADGFARLYGESPDMESAQGAFLALTRAGREDALRKLAQSEPLVGLLARRDAAEAFNGKRFLAAAFLEPQVYAAIGSAAAEQGALIAARRSKSGSAGMSRLDVQWQPALEAAIPMGQAGELRLRIDRVLLDSGKLPANMPIGTYPANEGAYAHSPTVRMLGWQPRLFWRDEREHVWEAEIGTTPVGGAVSAGWTSRLAYRDRAGRWHWAAYREPVRESILSYTGLRDPYQGDSWGRVRKTGALGGGRLPMGDRWAVSLQAAAEHLGGEQVAGNHHVAVEAGLSYSLKVAGLDYAVLGFSASAERFVHNLGHFTLGHGGYFSPQRYWRAGPSLDFMTEENRRLILRGRISAGRSGKQEEAAPLFPLAPDGRMYAASSGTGGAYDMEVSAVWRVNAHVQAGALWVKRHSPQYSDHAALGFVRIQFEPGKAALSSDLPASMGKELF